MDAVQARSDFAAWHAARPDNWYTSDRHLRALVAATLDPDRRSTLDDRATEFGGVIATHVPALVEQYEAPLRLPEAVPYDGAGNPVHEIRFDAAYHQAGRIIWGSGVVADAATAGRSYEIGVLSYLIAHEGEMGHACPVVCSIGLIRSLRRRADDEIAGRFLPPLIERDYDIAHRGAQFLTEVQGGSDVGSNALRADRVGDGTYRLTGEKWFCSVADADQFLVTARPDPDVSGTAGLGCFVVPRRVDGRPNGFTVRRLKDKLGTRGMASAEIDFEDAIGYPVGPVEEGFKTAVTAMLNTSRWLNAVGGCGMLRRSYVEAGSYALHRRAFGSPIAAFPPVRRLLAGLKVEWLAALYGTWWLTGLDEAVDTGAAGSDEEGLHRFLVNANKYVVSVRTTAAVRDAIEVLGGNGAIETFSVLPRLLRDAVVYEQWEGTHNVLVAQVLRDLGKLGLGAIVVDRISRTLKGITHPESAEAADAALAELEDLSRRIERSSVEPDYGALHFRGHLEQLMRVVQAAELLAAGDDHADHELGAELRAAADLMVRLEMMPGYRADDDPLLLERIDAVLGSDGVVQV